MLGTLDGLIAATVLFVGSHFVLSSRPLRTPLVKRLGEGPFLGLYSLVIVAAFAWMLLAFVNAPVSALWAAPRIFAWAPVIVMPIACILVVTGLTSPNPTLAGSQLGDQTALRVSGIITITRHPFLWGTGMWALSHIPINGTAAPVILFTGITALSFGGMAHIDARRPPTWVPLGGRSP